MPRLRRLLAEARVQFQACPRGICKKTHTHTHTVALGEVSLPALQVLPVSIIPPTLHSHSSIYHRRYITLATDNVVKQNT
jgi:hypothetical protein